LWDRGCAESEVGRSAQFERSFETTVAPTLRNGERFTGPDQRTSAAATNGTSATTTPFDLGGAILARQAEALPHLRRGG
jgi:hypothetical protein